MMKRRRLALLICAMLTLGMEQICAIEITGTVRAVNGEAVTVAMTGDSVPDPGDKAEIFFKLDGVEGDVSVATGSVVKVNGNSVEVRIEKATGEVVKDHLVRIDSANPKKPPAPGVSDSTVEARTRGLQEYNSGNFDAAIATYTKIIETDPSGKNYFTRGCAHSEKSNYSAAIADANKALELGYVAAEVYCLRGKAYAGAGDFARAISDQSQAIELDSKYSLAYYNRGNCKQRIGDFDGAIADYTKCITLDPTDTDAYYNRGVAYRDKGAPREAIADWEKAMQMDPTYRSKLEPWVQKLRESLK